MGMGEGDGAPLCFSAPLLGSDFRLQTSDVRPRMRGRAIHGSR